MHANPPSPPDRFLNGQWIVKIHSAAMWDGTESGQDTVWIWYTEPDLSAKLAEIAADIRDYGERYRRYTESADNEAFRVYRRYIALSELYRHQTGFERYVVFGPGSLPASVWRRELDERCIAGDFVHFQCNRCGESGPPARSQVADWEEGEGFGRIWGKQRQCSGCGNLLVNIMTGCLR